MNIDRKINLLFLSLVVIGFIVGYFTKNFFQQIEKNNKVNHDIILLHEQNDSIKSLIYDLGYYQCFNHQKNKKEFNQNVYVKDSINFNKRTLNKWKNLKQITN